MNDLPKEQPVEEKIGLDLVLYPNKTLTSGNEKVTKDQLQMVRDNIEIMEKMLLKYDGVGLAAPQAGINMQFFIIRHENCNINMINPAIVSISKEKGVDIEGCLSLPDIMVSVKRSKFILVNYLDENWEMQNRTFEEFEARIVAHEIDHLVGILLTHRMNEVDKMKNRFALRHLRSLAEDG